MRDTEFRVTRRTGEEASTPAYQAATTVRSRQKANTATAIPRMVSAARKRVPDGIAPGQFEHGCQVSVVSGQFSVVAQAFQPVPKYIVGCALRTTSGSQAQLGNQVTRRDALRFPALRATGLPAPCKGLGMGLGEGVGAVGP